MRALDQFELVQISGGVEGDASGSAGCTTTTTTTTNPDGSTTTTETTTCKVDFDIEIS